MYVCLCNPKNKCVNKMQNIYCKKRHYEQTKNEWNMKNRMLVPPNS